MMLYFIQRQPYRYTDCRCLIESYWDFAALIIFTGFAIMGVLAVADEIIKLRKKKNKK